MEVTNTKAGMLSSMATSTVCTVTVSSEFVNIAKGKPYTFSTESLNWANADDGIKLTDDITPNSTDYTAEGFVAVHTGDGVTTLDITIDLGSEMSFKQVAVDTLLSINGIKAIEKGSISYSSNGTDWTEMGKIDHTQTELGVETILVQSEALVTGRYVKLSYEDSNSWHGLAEIRVWGEAGETPPSDTSVDYTATGTVADISSDVTFADGKFSVPSTVSEFTFTDNGVSLKATKTDGSWTITGESLIYGVKADSNVTEGYGWEAAKPLPDNWQDWLTDGKAVINEGDISTSGRLTWGSVPAFQQEEGFVPTYTFELDPAKSFKQIRIGTVVIPKGDVVVATQPKSVKIELEKDGKWVTLFDNTDTPYTREDQNKVFVFSGDTDISGSKLRISTAVHGEVDAWPGTAINEIEVLADAASANVDGALTAPEGPVDTAATPTIGTDLEAAKTATVGDEVTFTVAASTTDAGTLSYQWYKNDVAIDGATEASYTISAAADTDAGSYKVVVTNTNGTATATATSTACVLTVEAPVVSDNLIFGKAYTLDATSHTDNDDSNSGDPSKTKLTDGVRFADPIAYNDGNSVLFKADSGVNDIVLSYDFGKDITFKEISMGVLRISGWGIDGMSNLQIEANIDGEWKTIYNANPNNATMDSAEVVTGKNDYFVSSDPITASGLRFTMTKVTAFIVLDEIEVKAEPTEGATKTGALVVPTAPAVEFTNVAKNASYTTTLPDKYYSSADHVWNDPDNKFLTDGVKGTAPWGQEFVCYGAFTQEETTKADWTWTIDLGGIKEINGVKFSGFAWYDTYYAYNPKGYTVSYIDEADESHQLTAVADTGVDVDRFNYGNLYEYSYEIPDQGTVKAKKIVITMQPYSNYLCIDEIEVMGVDNGEVPPADTADTPSIDTDLEAAKFAKIGDKVTFTVAASTTDSGILSYQWYKDDVAIDGAIEATYTIDSVADIDAGSYKVVVTNTNGTATATATSTVCALTAVSTANLLYGIPFTTAVAHDNFAGYSGLDADPNHVYWLTNGEASLEGSYSEKGHIAYAASGVGDADLTFNFGKEITFNQITLSTVKGEIWNAEDGVPDHITIAAQINGKWKTILDKSGFDRSVSKEFVFATDGEAITATGLKFYLYPRNGVAQAVHLTEIEVLADAGTATDGTLAFVADEEIAYDGNPTFVMVGNTYVKDGANPDAAALVSYDASAKKFIVAGGQGVTRFSFSDNGTAKTFVKTDNTWVVSDIDNLIFGIPYAYTEDKYHDSTPDANKIKLTDGNSEVATWSAPGTVGFFPDDGVAHINFDFGKSVTFKEIRLGNYAGDAGIQNVKNVKIEILKEDGTYMTILNLKGSSDFGAYHEFIFNSDAAFTAKGMRLTLVGNTGYHFYNELQVLAEKSADPADAPLAEEVAEQNPNLLADVGWTSTTFTGGLWNATTASTTLTDGVIATDDVTYANSVGFTDETATFVYDKPVSFKEAKLYTVVPYDFKSLTPTGIKVEVYKDGAWVAVVDKQDFTVQEAGKCYVFTTENGETITGDKVQFTVFRNTTADGRMSSLSLTEFQLFATPTGVTADAIMAMPEGVIE